MASAGWYGSKLPAYSSASTTNASPWPQRAVAGQPARDRRGQQRADERRGVRAGGHQQVDEPAGRRALAVRPGHADERPTDRRIRDDLLPRFDRDPGVARGGQLGLVGIDRGQRLGHRQAVGARRAGHVRRGVFRRDHDPDRLERRRVGRGPTRIAAGHGRARVRREECGGAGSRAGGADDVDPLEGPDRTGRPGGLEARPDAVGGRGHAGSAAGEVSSAAAAAPASTRSNRSSRAAAALSRLFSLRSPVQTCRRTATPMPSATAT